MRGCSAWPRGRPTTASGHGPAVKHASARLPSPQSKCKRSSNASSAATAGGGPSLAPHLPGGVPPPAMAGLAQRASDAASLDDVLQLIREFSLHLGSPDPAGEPAGAGQLPGCGPAPAQSLLQQLQLAAPGSAWPVRRQEQEPQQHNRQPRQERPSQGECAPRGGLVLRPGAAAGCAPVLCRCSSAHNASTDAGAPSTLATQQPQLQTARAGSGTRASVRLTSCWNSLPRGQGACRRASSSRRPRAAAAPTTPRCGWTSCPALPLSPNPSHACRDGASRSTSRMLGP